MTMLTYFLLPNLDASSDEANLHARIVRGDFVLFTYALSTWLDYIRRLCLRSEKSPLLTQLSGRLEQVFVRRAAEPPDLTKEPPKINKHMSAETQRKIAEEQRVRTLVEQIVKSVKGVPEFLSVVGINKWVYHTLCQVAMAGAAGEYASVFDQQPGPVIVRDADRHRRSQAWQRLASSDASIDVVEVPTGVRQHALYR